MATTNGGKTWDSLGKVPQDLVALQFLDRMNGWAVATYYFYHALFHTIDGGMSWVREAVGFTGHISGLSMLNLNYGYSAIGTGILMYSSLNKMNENQEYKRDFILQKNFPNPFNPSTTLRYQLKSPGVVRIKVFNVMGDMNATLFDGYQPIGWHEAEFTAHNLPSGIYFYTISVNGESKTGKMVLVK